MEGPAMTRRSRMLCKAQVKSALVRHQTESGPMAITLPRMVCCYGDRDITYVDGHLKAGDEIVRTRDGARPLRSVR